MRGGREESQEASLATTVPKMHISGKNSKFLKFGKTKRAKFESLNESETDVIVRCALPRSRSARSHERVRRLMSLPCLFRRCCMMLANFNQTMYRDHCNELQQHFNIIVDIVTTIVQVSACDTPVFQHPFLSEQGLEYCVQRALPFKNHVPRPLLRLPQPLLAWRPFWRDIALT